MRARWPDDIGILEAIAVEAEQIERDRRKDLAIDIANAVAEMIDKSS